MSAEIWNTYDLAVASGIGVFVGAVPVAALLILKRLDGARELATAKGWWEKAIKVQEANDKARWAPAYSENLFAIEADKPVDATVLHVKYPTQELQTIKMPAEQFDELVAGLDEGDYAPGLAALADEVGLVHALSDESEHTPACPDLFYCPTVDEVESGCHGGFDVCCVAPELHQPVMELRTMPALSDRPAEDEDEVGDEQPGEAASSVPSRIGDWWREQCARFRELFRRAPVNPPYTGRHWVSDVQHTGAWPLVVPKQRDGGDE